MELVGDNYNILNYSHALNAGTYNGFITAIRENPDLHKLLQEYCLLMQQQDIFDFGAERVLEILKLAEQDNLLGKCIGKIDESLEIISEVNQKVLTLEDLLSKIKTIPKQDITEEMFFALVQQVRLDPQFLSNYIKLNDIKYNREVIFSTPDICIYVICWKPGQETSIHLHENSFGFVSVYQGTLTGIEYEQAHTLGRESFKTISHRRYSQDQWLSVSLNKIHQLSNRESHNLITLHFKYFVSDPLDRDFKTPNCTKRDSQPEQYDCKTFSIT